MATSAPLSSAQAISSMVRSPSVRSPWSSVSQRCRPSESGPSPRIVALVREGKRWAIVEGGPRPSALAACIALATPVAETVVLLAGGTDLLGARNLNTASGGFAVLIGGLAVAAAPAIAYASVAALVGVFTLGTAKSFDPAYSTIDFRDAARFIGRDVRPGDVVVDMLSTQFSPVPTTPIIARVSGSSALVNIYQPTGPPPFLTAHPPPMPILERAVRQANGRRLFLVAPRGALRKTRGGLVVELAGAKVFVGPSGARHGTVQLPGWRLLQTRRFEGIGPVVVDVLASPQAGPEH